MNKIISDVVLDVISRHLWYLSEELAPLSFFDDSVPIKVKEKMISAFTKKKGRKENLKKFEVQAKSVRQLAKRSIDKFITKNSSHFFSCLGIDSDFLKEHPSTWSHNEAYKKGLEIVKNLRVTNDHAERGVALIQKYISMTKQEDQLQYLLHIVERNRKELPKVSKSSLAQYFQK